jgi:hypothetical protein
MRFFKILSLLSIGVLAGVSLAHSYQIEVEEHHGYSHDYGYDASYEYESQSEGNDEMLRGHRFSPAGETQDDYYDDGVVDDSYHY